MAEAQRLRNDGRRVEDLTEEEQEELVENLSHRVGGMGKLASILSHSGAFTDEALGFAFGALDFTLQIMQLIGGVVASETREKR